MIQFYENVRTDGRKDVCTYPILSDHLGVFRRLYSRSKKLYLSKSSSYPEVCADNN